MGRRLLWAVLLVAALIAGGLTVYQHVAAARLRTGFADWESAAHAAGWQVSSGAVSVSGWPRSAVLEVPNFRISGTSGGPLWETQRLRLVLDLFRPDYVTVLAEGRQRAGVSGEPEQTFTGRLLRVVVPLRPAAGEPAAILTARGVAMPGDGVAIGSLTGELLAMQPDVRFRVAAQVLQLPGDEPWPLGREVAEVAADGMVAGKVPGPGPVEAAVRAWRAAGGRLEVQDGAIRWGQLNARFRGTAGLDGDLQPVASGTAWLSGYAQALDAMAVRHVMSNDGALAAKAVLSLLARVPAGGGPAQVEVPFGLKDEVLSVGPVPLVRVRRVVWG